MCCKQTLYASMLGLSFVVSGCSPSMPFIKNNVIWGALGGEPVVNCAVRSCFPHDINAEMPCLMRCLYTENEHGETQAFAAAFKDKRKVDIRETAYFVIAYGPPASGKSSVQATLKSNNIIDVESDQMINVVVDSIFQSGQTGLLYEKARKGIIAKSEPSERDKLTQRLYAFYRWVADQISTGILNQALAGHYHVNWETTGRSITWTQQEINRIRSYGYQTLIAYPLASTPQLLVRAKRRAQPSGQESALARTIVEDAAAAQINLVEILPAHKDLKRKECPIGSFTHSVFQNIQKNKKVGCRANRLVLIDNTGEIGQEKIVFDTENPAKYCQPFLKISARLNIEKKMIDAIKVYCP